MNRTFMRHGRRLMGAPLLALIATATASPAQCSNCGATCHVVSGAVSDGAGGPFVAGHVYLANGDLTVPAGAVLTIGAGVIVKFDGLRSFDVQGTLVANGSSASPIVFTSIRDDEGGDHNGDGGATWPADAQWIQIRFGPGSSASRLDHVIVRCAGYAGSPAVLLDQSNLSMSRSQIDLCGGPCLDLSENSAPSVSFCKLDRGTVAADRLTVRSLAGFRRCTPVGNRRCNAPRVTLGTIYAGDHAIVRAINTFNGDGVIQLATGVFVGAGATLDVRPGVVFKFSTHASFHVVGTAIVRGIGDEPVVFTSWQDDEFGGDSNLNGAANGPGPGQWKRIYVDPIASGHFKHVLVRCGGGGGSDMIDARAVGVGRGSIRCDLGGGRGMRFVDAAEFVLDNLVAWGCAGVGVFVESGHLVRHASVANRGGAGIETTNASSFVHNSVSFGNAEPGFAGFAIGAVHHSCGSGLSGGLFNFDADPLFEDAASGNLQLAAASPCIAAAEQLIALEIVHDHVDASRIADGLPTGSIPPDMGAYEHVAYRFVVSGKP